MPELVGPAVAAGRLRSDAQPWFKFGDLTLRPFRASDSGDIVEAYTDPGIQRWHVRSLTDDEAAEWITQSAARWDAETGANWAVIAAGSLVGRVGLRTINLSEGGAEVAYWTMPRARGQGIAVRAVRQVSSWLLDEIGLARLELHHSVANPASCRVATKAGFAYEGTRRRSLLHADGWHDMHLHGLVSGDARCL